MDIWICWPLESLSALWSPDLDFWADSAFGAVSLSHFSLSNDEKINKNPQKSIKIPKIFSAPSAPTPPKQGGAKTPGGIKNLANRLDYSRLANV